MLLRAKVRVGAGKNDQVEDHFLNALQKLTLKGVTSYPRYVFLSFLFFLFSIDNKREDVSGFFSSCLSIHRIYSVSLM
jgi:hypothetical protein